uniref:Protein YIPF n=2 Tax=Chrysotila carterae TaxID=13221 RepID=A0A7S4BA80_CHRCT
MLKPQQMASVMPDDGEGRPAASGGFWTLKYYQPLFDVDTLQVLTRLKASLLPRPRGVFFDLISTTPDLYGPFWIATTLIFSMAITGNLASFFAFKPTEANPKWTYNFNQLTLAGSVVYSYVTVLPLLLWLLLRYYEAGKRLVDILCIYGYTLGIFVPISVLCVLPSDILRWLLVLVGGGISGVFLLSNFHAHFSDCFPYGESEAKRKMYILLGGMCFFHVLLLFLFKLYFFHYQ